MATFSLEEKILKVNKKNFKYIQKGKGQLVLMIHGWPENCNSWLNQISFISKLGYKAVAINVRGYADSYSPHTIQSYKLKFFMEDIKDIIKIPIIRDIVASIFTIHCKILFFRWNA